MKKKNDFISYIIIISVVVLIRTFLITPIRVVGSSMDKTLKAGEILLLEKVDKNYKRYDIVAGLEYIWYIGIPERA